MNKFYLFCLSSVLLCSCSHEYVPTEKDRLTPQEEEVIITHVRGFILRSKKIGLSLEERSLIQDKKPELVVHYKGYKEGELFIRWSLPNYRTLLLKRNGKLLSNARADWVIRIISDTASGKLPKNYFGAKGEELSLPPL